MKPVYRAPKKSKTKNSLSEQEKIDRILDKISASGYDSLTEEEKAILFKAGKNKSSNEIKFSGTNFRLDQCVDVDFSIDVNAEYSSFFGFSILNLFVPVVVLLNLLFFFYWLVKMKWPFYCLWGISYWL